MNILLDADARPVIGHRGNRAHAPENTLESFRQAIALGADALEMDVRLTSDGEVVVLHDPTVDRTTDGRGAVASFTWSEVRRLDAGARFSADGGRTFSYRGRGIRIPAFAEVLEAFPNIPILVEVKTATAAPRLRELIEQHGAEDRCIVEAFDEAATRAFLGSKIAVGASTADVRRLLTPALLRRPCGPLAFRVMSIPRWFRGVPVPIAALVRATRPEGAVVHVWTINDPRVARRLWAIGVCGIVSDDPGRMLAARRDIAVSSP